MNSSDLASFHRLICHDLKEPLRAMRGSFDMLHQLRGAETGLQESSVVNFGRAAVSRMEQLVDSLKQVHLATTERPQRVDLAEVVEASLADLATSVTELDAATEIGDLPTVEGYQVQLRQLFQNLIANSLKHHSPQSSPRIAIWSQEFPNGVAVFFQDNGPGISEELWEKVFEAGVRGRSTSAGLGLGLFIAHSSVAQHGGKLSIARSDSRGTIFKIELPWLQQSGSMTYRSGTVDFEGVLDSMEDFVLVKDEHAKLVWANRPFREYYNLSNAQLYQLVDAEHSDPNDTIVYLKDDHTVFSKGISLRLTEPITDSNGKTAYFETVKTPIRDDGDRVYQTVGVSRPFADGAESAALDWMRDQRKESISEVNTLVKALPIPAAFLDAKARLICCSAEWAGVFSTQPFHLEGRFYHETCEPQLNLGMELAQALEEKKRVAVQAREIRGGELIVNVQIQPWYLAEGEVGGTVVSLEDITDGMRKKEALKRRNQELSQLNYRLSHDFVGPLRSIEGLAQVLRLELADHNAVVNEALQKMQNELKQLHELLRNSKLLMADPERENETSGKVSLEPLAVKAWADCGGPESGLKLELDLELCDLQTDQESLGELLRQLLSNAVKHGDFTSHKTVNVSSAEMLGKRWLAVRSPGAEIPERDRSRLFDLFQRSGSRSGSGLGLYVARTLASELGAEISYRHNEGSNVFEVAL